MLFPSSEEFLKLIEQSDKTVFADFYANWCGPCKMLAPLFEKLDERYGEKAVFVKLDVDALPELADKFAVNTIPNVKAFKGGKIVEQKVGYLSEAEMDSFIVRNM